MSASKQSQLAKQIALSIADLYPLSTEEKDKLADDIVTFAETHHSKMKSEEIVPLDPVYKPHDKNRIRRLDFQSRLHLLISLEETDSQKKLHHIRMCEDYVAKADNLKKEIL